MTPWRRPGAPSRDKTGAPSRDKTGAPSRDKTGAPSRDKTGAPLRDTPRRRQIQAAGVTAAPCAVADSNTAP
jgi:hypothetical protein